MPAALRVCEPGNPPLYAWLQAEVVRIGAGADCDVRIEGVDPHLATIVFRDGEYHVVNRSREPLLLNGKPLPPGAEAIWPDGGELALPREIEVALVRHRNPAPLETQPWRRMPEFDAPEKERQARLQWRRQAACFLTTAAALFVTGALMAWPSADTADAQYLQLVDALSAGGAADFEKSPYLQDALGWIQAAHGSERRGEREQARRRYLAVRDLLLARGEPHGALLRQQVLNYVAERLKSI